MQTDAIPKRSDRDSHFFGEPGAWSLVDPSVDVNEHAVDQASAGVLECINIDEIT